MAAGRNDAPSPLYQRQQPPNTAWKMHTQINIAIMATFFFPIQLLISIQFRRYRTSTSFNLSSPKSLRNVDVSNAVPSLALINEDFTWSPELPDCN